ncbi:MAG: TraV family lipoprotein [Desulforhopalus sp.]
MKTFNQIVCHSSLLFLILFAGCGPILNPYNEDFKCRAKDDAGECIDTPTAYKKARYPESVPNEAPEPTIGLKQEIQDNRYKVLAGLLQEEKKPLLQPPKILRVLLLPYKGEGEELFMSRYIYIKIEDSKWILTDLAEQ